MADPVPTSSGAEPGPVPPPASASLLTALLRTARPKQWMKNVLVVAAPAAAGVLDHRTVILDTVVAFVAFCLAASGTYFLNDAFDVEADRRHAKKRFRPIAAGVVPVPLARLVGVLLLAAGVGVSFLANWRLALVIGVYVVFTTTYSAW